MNLPITVILVNYRRTEETIECVRSLHNCLPGPEQIIVVDNGSTADSAQALRAGCPGVILLESTRNLGFAGGNNLGIRRAIEQQVRYILLLNNDTIVEPDALAKLSAAAEVSRQAGVLGAKIRYFDNHKILWYAGGTMNPASGHVTHFGMGEPDTGQYDHAVEVGFVTGCCMFIRREVLETVGLLDETFFAYLEDVDFSFRARRAGFQILYEPSAIIYHKVSRSTLWDSPAYLYFNLRNRLLLRRRHSSWLQAAQYFPSFCWYYIRQFLRLALRWRDTAGLRGAWYGLVDGLMGFTGEDGSGRLALLPPANERTNRGRHALQRITTDVRRS